LDRNDVALCVSLILIGPAKSGTLPEHISGQAYPDNSEQQNTEQPGADSRFSLCSRRLCPDMASYCHICCTHTDSPAAAGTARTPYGFSGRLQ